MGKIYYGERGSGKTIKLLKQAEALKDEGLIPVIVAVRKDFIETLKYTANRMKINIADFVFLTFTEAKKPENHFYFTEPVYRIMIDELTVFIRDILGIKNNFYATLSSENCKEIKRTNWEK